MRKAERLFQILTILRGRRTVITATQIASVLEVSERTIYRDIQALSLSGIPIESETGIGYRLKPGFTIPPIMFTEAEIEALLLGVRMVESWAGADMASSANSALQKIHAALPDKLHQKTVQQPEWLVVPNIQASENQFSDNLGDAIKAQQQVKISYKDEQGRASTRAICPLGLLYWGKVWTLVSWCTLRDDYRMFRLDRIETLVPLSESFDTSDTMSLQHYMSQYCEEAES